MREENKYAVMVMEGSKEENAVKNIFMGGQCQRCESKDVSQAVSCLFCCFNYHVIKCYADQADNTFPESGFKNTLGPAIRNESVAWSNRPGKVVFVCDTCITLFETDRATTKEEKVDKLDKRVEEISTDICMMKDMLIKLTETNNMPAAKQKEQATENTEKITANVWNDKQRVKNLKQLVVISKDKHGNQVNQELLEKTCSDNGIQVTKTFQLSKSDATGILVPSKRAADTLLQKLDEKLPQHKTKRIVSRTPTINVVGLSREYDNDELKSIILRQNPEIKELVDNTHNTNSEGDDKFDILAVTPLKSNSKLFQARIKVSNIIRSVIGDRLYVGFNSCKIFDHFYSPRCFNCQQYNHLSNQCDKPVVCGFCGEEHETQKCSKKDDPTAACCVNCKSNGGSKESWNHPAYSPHCPVYKQQQQKIRKSIPFYQGNNPGIGM